MGAMGSTAASSFSSASSPQLIKDTLCACRQFDTPVTGWKEVLEASNDTLCDTFFTRWEATIIDDGNNSSRSTRLFGDYNRLHALAFKELSSPNRIIIAFRHQEGEMLWDSDQQEGMGLWGRNVVQLFGGKSWFGANTVLSFLAESIQLYVFNGPRKFLGIDYLSQSDTIVSRIAYEEASIIFTGYSMGGAIAQIQAIRRRNINNNVIPSAILFASNGILDILKLHYPEDYSFVLTETTKESSILNLFESKDLVPRMDCQLPFTRVCTFNDSQSRDDVHENLVYGNGLSSVLMGEENNFLCLPGLEWNSNANASCLATEETKPSLMLLLPAILGVIMYLIFNLKRKHTRKQFHKKSN